MDLWVANADGTDARQVTYLPGASFGPSFYPDGKRIIFASNYLDPKRPASSTCSAIDLDGTHLERITYAPRLRRLPDVLARRQEAVVLVEPARRRREGRRRGLSHDRRPRRRARHQRVRRRLGRRRRAAPYQPETAPVDRYHDAVELPRRRRARGPRHRHEGPRATAQDYVQKQLADAGVEPGAPGGGWRQTFEVIDRDQARRRRPRSRSTASRSPPTDFAPLAFSARLDERSAVVASVGHRRLGHQARRLQGQGRQGQDRARPPLRAGRSRSSTPTALRELGDLRKKAFTAKQGGAVGLIVVDDGDPKARRGARCPSCARAASRTRPGSRATPASRSSSSTRKAAGELAKGRTRSTLAVAARAGAHDRPTTSSA